MRRKYPGRYERIGNHSGISGLGLGLWIVKKILEASGGHISVASIPGEGTTFTVKLPMVAEDTLLLPEMGLKLITVENRNTT